LCAILLLLSYIAVWVHPKYFWLLSLNGLLFPVFLVLNLFFVVFWLLAKKKQFILSAIVILIGTPFIVRYFQMRVPFKKQPDVELQEKAIKVLSYNVRLFNLYKWMDKQDVAGEIIKFINKENPDVLCLQEFYTKANGKYSEKHFIEQLLVAKYSYISYSYKNSKKSSFGMAIFSKFPITQSGDIPFGKTYNQCIYADIKHHNDTIRVYNAHLQSFRFIKQDYDFMDSIKLKYNPEQVKGWRNILYKVKTATIKRANQADSIAAHIAQSKYPLIICGDFNDSPTSYTYHKIKNGLKDSFIEAGSGIGLTYITKFPSFRIDYILHHPSLIAFNYQSPAPGLSDHNPVICYIVKK
jgi:endonuclease/exonuclease/phosphatase family metal-dependent hydrolase